MPENRSGCKPVQHFWNRELRFRRHGSGLPKRRRFPNRTACCSREFGEGLGVSDVEGQIAHCTLYAEKLEFLLRQARTEQTQKSKLYVTLGISAGAVLGLLVM